MKMRMRMALSSSEKKLRVAYDVAPKIRSGGVAVMGTTVSGYAAADVG